jgi:hypothetical protein
MSTNYLDKVQEAIIEVKREIEEARAHLSYLEGVAENLRKCLPHPTLKPTTNTPISLYSDTTEPEAETDNHPMKVIGTNEVRMVRFRRKNSHATKVAKIIKQYDKPMKVQDIVNAYPKYGWNLSAKNGFNQIYRTIRDREDLFVYTDDKFVLLKERQQDAHKEVAI